MTTLTPDAPIHLNAAGRRVQIATLIALAVVALCSFAVAYPGLVWVGVELASLPLAVAVLLPIAIDAGMLTAGLAAAVRRSQRRTARLEFAQLLGLVAVSVVAQITHVIAAQGQWSPLMAVGALVAAAAPVTLLLATEAVLRSVLTEAPTRRRVAPRAAAAQVSASGSTKEVPSPPAKPVRSAAPQLRSPADRDARLADENYVAAVRELIEGAPGTSQNKVGARFHVSKTTVGKDAEYLRLSLAGVSS
ncbi:hypothetical protein [Microbacterium laevaniformans]|uniref:hypothetical protein n=1 Tax=Microbacterium laevaniformans TaxID=36807 RepID=UPI003D97B1C4